MHLKMALILCRNLKRMIKPYEALVMIEQSRRSQIPVFSDQALLILNHFRDVDHPPRLNLLVHHHRPQEPRNV